MSNKKNELIENSIISLQNNNISMLETLYNLIKDDVYAYALSKICNKFDADDIMQDTFVQIYRNANLYDCKGKPLAWIFTIENNLINRYFQIKNKKVDLDENILINFASENIDENKLDNQRFLKSLLLNLSKQERTIISLHIVSSLKFKEISKILNIPLSTVLSKYNRAIKKLKVIVKEEKKYEN